MDPITAHLGQHTDEVLQKLAGYSVEEVKRLREAKVVS